MDAFIGLMFWGAIAFGIWWWVRNRKVRGIPSETKTLWAAPTRDPLNSDIISKLYQIKQSIEIVEAQTKKVQKSVRDISHWLWLLPIGFIIGLYWDNIVSVFKSLFPGLLTGLFLLLNMHWHL